MEKGISIVVPTYKGEKHIKTLLNSLKEQTLDYNLFEAIFIVNGELDETPNIIKDFQSKNPEMNIVLTDSEKGASHAHNKGISVASREYLAFVDDDDFISQNYLKRFLEHAKPNRIVVGFFQDVDEDTGEIKDSYITENLPKKSGVVHSPYTILSSALTVVHDKLIPTFAVKDTLFDVNLINGDDVVYSSTLYSKNDFEFYYLSKEEDAVYYRLLRSDSLSRPESSYNFNISQRLKVINELFKIFPLTDNNDLKLFLKKLIFAQFATFIRPYVNEHPEDTEKVITEIEEYNFDYLPYWYLEDADFTLSANELVISYPFPPSYDTMGNGVAKRILYNKMNVDVLTGANNDSFDKSMSFVLNDFIRDRMEVNVKDSYLKLIKDGLKLLDKKQTYKKIYTGANFTPFYLIGLFYKSSHETYWRAEFANINLDKKPINDDNLVKKINKVLPVEFANVKVGDNINEVVQYSTFIMADEIIFNNENQMKIMVEEFPEIKEMVLSKSKVMKQPILGDIFYYLNSPNYEIDDSYVNFAYFGSFDKNRGFEDFIAGFSNLSTDFKDKFKLHIFTPNQELFKQVLPPELLEKTKISPPVQYFDFLNLTTKMDVLLVNDSQTSIYPPSKLSDYLGSGTDIWAVCYEESEMDKVEDIKYKSNLNDFNSSTMTINQIMSDKMDIEVETKDLTKDELIRYYQERQLHISNNTMNLSKKIECTKAKQELHEYKKYLAHFKKFMRPKFIFNFFKKLTSKLL